MKGLIIKDPWITKILNGEKTWEIRGSNTKHRGRTGLIKSGTGKIYGSADLVDTHLISVSDYDNNRDKHRVDEQGFWGFVHYEKPWAWVFKNPMIYPHPIAYDHKQGCVIWVKL